MSSESPSYKSGEELSRSITMDIRGIVRISQLRKKPFKPLLFQIALGIWCIIIIIIAVFQVPPYPLIIEIKDLLISLLPGILGFTIGGYSILIGFTQQNLIEKISGPRKDSVYSLYQLASASFASNILIQACVLIGAYLVHLFCWIDQNKKIVFKTSDSFTSIINWAALLFILFGFIISVFIILQLICNVFNFSQLYHYNINKIKIDEAPRRNDE